MAGAVLFMRLYVAALYTNNFGLQGNVWDRLDDAEKRCRASVENYLESYHYIHKQSYVEKIRADGVKVFLDSGAFSAFTQGIKVDLPKYCDYIKQNIDIIEKSEDGDILASVLDGIGDDLQTFQNQHYMQEHGVRPLPCFHYGEDDRYLEWYIKNYNYITIGGMVPVDKTVLVHWLDRIWEKYLTDGSGNPRLKVHGFGLTTYNLMERYPWYSVDSSSWVQAAGNGSIVLPDFFDDKLAAVAVSENSPARKAEGRHLDNMSAREQQRIIDYLAKDGISVDRCRTEYLTRWAYNAGAYAKLGSNMAATKAKTFVAPQPEIWDYAG